jgi:hypothetical protein
MDKPEIENVSHYKGDFVMRIIEAFSLGFCLGNVVKYILRAGRKTPDKLTDLKKAKWYLEREINNLQQGDKQTKNEEERLGSRLC